MRNRDQIEHLENLFQPLLFEVTCYKDCWYFVMSYPYKMNGKKIYIKCRCCFTQTETSGDLHVDPSYLVRNGYCPAATHLKQV